MREALAAQGNHLAELELLSAMHRAFPQDTKTAASLNAALAKFGFEVTKIHVNDNAFPTRACIKFTTRLSKAPDFHPADWVTVSPKLKNLSVTRDNGALCVMGIPAGTSATVTLRAGLPAEGGRLLPKDKTLKVAFAARKANIIADDEHFIIPVSSRPSIGFASVNVSSVNIEVARVAERSLIGFLGSHPLSNPNLYMRDISAQNSTVVWHGKAAIPGFKANRLVHTILPLPPVMRKPGLYAVQLSPGDGTPNPYNELTIVQLVLRTDMAPTIWRGRDGLHVQLRHFSSALPYPGSTVSLIAADNAVLARARTNWQGVVFFPGPLLAGSGGAAPVALHIENRDRDFTLFDLTTSPFNLSDRGVSGRPEPKPIDPFLWLDRGIYRPGETVHVSALYRSAAGKPLDLPLHLIVRRPGGQVYEDRVPVRQDDDSVSVPVKISGGAQAGNWTVSLSTGLRTPPLAQRTFTVAAFVPPQIAVSLGTTKSLSPSSVTRWPVNVRFLYGAPGADLTGTSMVSLKVDPKPFVAWRDYAFGLHGEIFESSFHTQNLSETDSKGDTSASIDLTSMPDSTHALEAKLEVSVNDPAGRAVNSAITLPIMPTRPLIGIRELFHDKTIGAGNSPGIEVVALNPQGQPVRMRASLSLVRQDPEWHILFRGDMARWAITYVDRSVLSREIEIPARPMKLALPSLDYGRYRLRVVEAHNGLAASSVVFYSGWQISSNPGIPHRVTVASDHHDYPAGAIAKLHITAPFGGPATLVIANDGVRLLRDFTVPKQGVTIGVPVSDAWGAGAYAIVNVFRPVSHDLPPQRAIGLTWLGVQPGRRALKVLIPVHPLYRPRRTIIVPVRTAPGAYVTLAAVDEGVLRLTRFQSPDPITHYFGQRRLGVGINDEYGALLRRPSGVPTILQNGAGSDFGPSQPPIPQKVVALFAGPVRAAADGIAQMKLRLPDFNGEIRLMAVAWARDAVGAAHADITVRNRVIAEVLLPRFLAPGDRAIAGLMLQDLDLPGGQFDIAMHATGAVQLTSPANLKLNLRRGVRTVLPVTLLASTMGTGHIALDLRGVKGYQQEHTWAIGVHPARAAETTVTALTLAPGATTVLSPQSTDLITGSVMTSATFGNSLPFDPAAYLQALESNPLPFLAQSASRGLPLTVLRGAAAGPDRRGRLQHAVDQVLDLQRFDGSFGLWSSQDHAEPWLSAFASEFLLRAKRAGAYVPNSAMEQALAWLRREIEDSPGTGPARVYAAYVLGLAGEPPAGAIRIMAQNLDKYDMPLTLAQLGAALNYIGEQGPARAALQSALAMHTRFNGTWYFLNQDWAAAFGSPLRDAWAVPAVVMQTGLLRSKRANLADNLPGKSIEVDDLNSQELAWACFAAGIVAGKPESMELRLDKSIIKEKGAFTRALTGHTRVRNLSPQTVPIMIATTGIPATAPAAASQGMQVSRRFYSLDGKPLDPSKLKQNTVFVMVVSGRAVDSVPHRALLVAGLPAGWEVAGHISSAETAQFDWLGSLTKPRARAATDDAYEAIFNLQPPNSYSFGGDNGMDQEFRVAVRIRAVTPGHFEFPGVTLSDMFHPAIFARTATRRIEVLPP
ncbi:MAG: alpha-2-macroglobulin family protein [Gammaproteobacteria bacterium]